MTAFTDDRQTDLLRGLKQSPFKLGLEVLAADCQSLRVSFTAPGLPAQGSRKLKLAGTLAVDVGKVEKTVEVKDADLSKGVDLRVGTLEPRRLGKGKGGGTIKGMYTYTGTRPLKALVLLDAAGKEVVFRQVIRSGGFGSKANSGFQVTFFTDGNLERCTVRATYFDTVERIAVPIALEVGVGF